MLKTIFLIMFIVGFIWCMLSDIKVRMAYDEKFTLIVQFMFIKVNVTKLMEKFKKKPKEEKPKKEKKPEEKTKKLFDNTNQMIALAKKALSGITKTIVFEDIDIKLSIGTDDAKSTAMLCGYAYSAAYILDPFLSENFRLEKKSIAVTPRFNVEVFDFAARVWIRARLINLIIFAVSLLIAYKRIKKENAGAGIKKEAASVT